MTSRCRSCDAPIRWIRTASKRMPVDAAPDPERGNVLIGLVGGEEIATVLSSHELASSRANRDPLYLSHFVTCPQAAQWRTPAPVSAEAASPTRRAETSDA